MYGEYIKGNHLLIKTCLLTCKQNEKGKRTKEALQQAAEQEFVQTCTFHPEVNISLTKIVTLITTKIILGFMIAFRGVVELKPWCEQPLPSTNICGLVNSGKHT